MQTLDPPSESSPSSPIDAEIDRILRAAAARRPADEHEAAATMAWAQAAIRDIAAGHGVPLASIRERLRTATELLRAVSRLT